MTGSTLARSSFDELAVVHFVSAAVVEGADAGAESATVRPGRFSVLAEFLPQIIAGHAGGS